MSSKAVRTWGGGKFVVTLPRNVFFARVVLLPDDLHMLDNVFCHFLVTFVGDLTL